MTKYSDREQTDVGSLVFEFATIARYAEPVCFVIENVPTMLASRFSQLLAAAFETLRFEMNPRRRVFYTAAAVLSASDFGVPQSRKRLIIIGVRADVAETIGVRGDDDVLGLFPTPTHAPVTVRTALNGLAQSHADIEPWRRAMLTNRLGNVVAKLPREPVKLTRPIHVGLPGDTNFSLARCAWNLPAPTLTVVGQSPGGLSGAIHPAEDRKFTIPELKRLTGVPDEYVLTGTLAQGAERLCRMVPPPLMYAVAEALYRQVILPFREATDA